MIKPVRIQPATVLALLLVATGALAAFPLTPGAAVLPPDSSQSEVKQLVRVTRGGKPAAAALIMLDGQTVGSAGKTGEIYLMLYPGRYMVQAIDPVTRSAATSELWVYTGRKPAPLSLSLNPGALVVAPMQITVEGVRGGVITSNPERLSITTRFGDKPLTFSQVQVDLGSRYKTADITRETVVTPGNVAVTNFPKLVAPLGPGPYTIKVTGIGEGKVHQDMVSFDLGLHTVKGTLVSPDKGQSPAGAQATLLRADGLRLVKKVSPSGAYNISGVPVGDFVMSITGKDWSLQRNITIAGNAEINVVMPAANRSGLFFGPGEDWRKLPVAQRR